MREARKCTEFWFSNLRGRDHFGDIRIDWRIILKCVSETYGVSVYTGVNFLSIGHTETVMCSGWGDHDLKTGIYCSV
jgi:hypothetical protein